MRLRQRLSRCGQHIFHDGDDASQQLLLPEHIAAPQAHVPGNVPAVPRDCPKGHGDHRIELEQIRHIVDERQRFAGMDEAYGRRIACRKDSRLTNAVQAMIGDTDSLVDRIGASQSRGS